MFYSISSSAISPKTTSLAYPFLIFLCHHLVSPSISSLLNSLGSISSSSLLHLHCTRLPKIFSPHEEATSTRINNHKYHKEGKEHLASALFFLLSPPTSQKAKPHSLLSSKKTSTTNPTQTHALSSSSSSGLLSSSQAPILLLHLQFLNIIENGRTGFGNQLLPPAPPAASLPSR